MNENEKLLSIKSDFVFKLIFGDPRNVDILADFLMSVLDLPVGEYDRLTVVDPHVKKESEDDKFGILDVRIHSKSGNVIHAEVQLLAIPEMIQRILYYQSKMITEQMASGYTYERLQRVVSILITDFSMLKNNEFYHNQFRYRSDKNSMELTNLIELNILELPKLPPEADNTKLWDWMKVIKSDDREAMEVIAGRNPQIKKAVGILKDLSADERTRMLTEEREKAWRDYASRIDGARREGRTEGRAEGRAEGEVKGRFDIARNMLGMNIPPDTIVKATGLTHAEIENLQ